MIVLYKARQTAAILDLSGYLTAFGLPEFPYKISILAQSEATTQRFMLSRSRSLPSNNDQALEQDHVMEPTGSANG
ncbi:hypothetical protein RRG08_034507 [Elysia crispata]|uniref:Uncharacterized protein n=1 Tax=Elysia crispata TaxID=231223 RepID=A0AAE1BBC1_9GAST|nr:hypothetical protein RRG08_034507 [Elysia crispata]